MLSEPARFRDWIHSFGYSGILVFIFFQIFQVVIATIPGEVVQIAGGYIYGVWLGTLYLVIGVIIGSIIVFYASRLLGYPLIKVFVRQDKLTLLYSLIRNQKADLALFILFLVPGLPKDILSYIAGLTPVKPLRFFVIATLGRSPALFVSAYIGSNLHAKNYLAAVILSSIAIILIFVGFLYKDRFITKIHIIFSSHKS
ncbi:TVP38/TMEM64 family protein [Desulfitobacterium metallireducens]|nr:VTT domain-containing protein [Desulfitobacterium metallireducens]